MKYFTKEWYKDCQRTSLHFSLEESQEAKEFSEEYFQHLYKLRLDEMIAQEKEIEKCCEEDEVLNVDTKPPILNLETVEQNYSKAFAYNVDYLRDMLPQIILDDVADIRILALNKATKQNIRKIRSFANSKKHLMDRISRKYYSYYRRIKKKLQAFINEDFNMHDCIITSASFSGRNFILEFDHEGGFTDIKTMVLENARILHQEHDFINAWWIYNEIYIINDCIELHVLFHVPQGQDGDSVLSEAIFQANAIKCVHDTHQENQS